MLTKCYQSRWTKKQFIRNFSCFEPTKNLTLTTYLGFNYSLLLTQRWSNPKGKQNKYKCFYVCCCMKGGICLIWIIAPTLPAARTHHALPPVQHPHGHGKGESPWWGGGVGAKRHQPGGGQRTWADGPRPRHWARCPGVGGQPERDPKGAAQG